MFGGAAAGGFLGFEAADSLAERYLPTLAGKFALFPHDLLLFIDALGILGGLYIGAKVGPRLYRWLKELYYDKEPGMNAHD